MDYAIHALPLFQSLTIVYWGERTRLRKNDSGSCSSRVDAGVVAYEADVDLIDFEEEDAITESDDDDDAVVEWSGYHKVLVTSTLHWRLNDRPSEGVHRFRVKNLPHLM